ncbi:MAG: IclR family transcriptional regulator [Acidimicrobiales bacterium]
MAVPTEHDLRNGDGRSYTVSSVDNAMRLLSALKDRPSLSVKEGAELLGVAPSTAHRLLTTLQGHGFIAQDSRTRRYGPGPALLEVALATLQRVDVRRVAHPHLVALSAAVRETATLGVLEGTTVRFIDSVEGPQLVRVGARTGDQLPAHVTAVGKVLLASLSDTELRRRFPEARLPGLTNFSTTSRAVLFDELAQVHAQGFATSFQQSSVGLCDVAVAVSDPQGNVLAAVGVSAPAARLERRQVTAIVEAARQRVQRIEDELRGPAFQGAG